MTPTLTAILLIVTSSTPLTALKKDCVLNIEETDKKWKLYQITETIGLIALRCHKRIEYQDVCGGKNQPPNQIHWALNQVCTTALETKIYHDENANYSLPTTNEDILVGCTTTNCLKAQTFVNVEKISLHVTPSTDEVRLRSGIICNVTTGFCDGNKHWFLLGKPDRAPGTKRVFKRVHLAIENAYFLQQKGKRYLVFERDSEEVALEIVNESIVDGKNVLLTGERAVVLSSDDSIRDNWDDHVGEQLPIPHFIPKRDLVDALTKGCRMYDALQGKMADEDPHGRIQLVSYYLSIFNSLCSLCVLLLLGFNVYKKVFCGVQCGGPEEESGYTSTNRGLY